MKTLIVLFTVGTWGFATSQTLARSTAFIELGGASFFYSVNYDYLLFKGEKNNMSVRAGLMAMPFPTRRMEYAAPVSVSYLRGLKKNFLETGFSFSYIYDQYLDSNDQYVWMPSFRIGIRKRPMTAGFFWNALIQASLVSVSDYKKFDLNNSEWFITPMASFGGGYSF